MTKFKQQAKRADIWFNCLMQMDRGTFNTTFQKLRHWVVIWATITTYAANICEQLNKNPHRTTKQQC